MIKVAQDSNPVTLMSLYVAYLRALYQLHQNAHWKTKGSNFYGNHLLFQRLYEGTQESVDEAAEKALGVFGELKENNDLIKDIVNKFNVENFDNDYIQSLLKAEQAFLALSQTLYNQLKNLKAMTLGLDDLIMSIANRHEVHVYLLKQVVDEN